MSLSKLWPAVTILGFTLIGCDTTSAPSFTPMPGQGEATPAVQVGRVEPLRFGYTHQRPDGNRMMLGRGALPEASPIDILLEGTPQWVVAAPVGSDSLWVAVLDNGRVQAFRIEGAQAREVSISPEQLPPGMPPLLRIADDRPTLVTAPDALASPVTPPVVLQPSGRLAFIQSNGDLVIRNDAETALLALNTLPDGRLLTDERERVLLLTNATKSYSHGVLGDTVEAAGITLVETVPSVRVLSFIPLPDGDVVEGIAPIWTDLNGDGVREIVVTVSNTREGARIVVFNESGEKIAAGPAVGRGFRWRHQLAVAPFGPGGEIELTVVRTPHIGGVVEFYRLEKDTLRIVAQVPGYRSHVLGSRNLDMALAGDLDGDGFVELLVPDQGLTNLGVIRRTAEGAEVAWTIPLGGRANTNIAAVTTAEGRLIIGVGRQDGVLRVWPSP